MSFTNLYLSFEVDSCSATSSSSAMTALLVVAGLRVDLELVAEQDMSLLYFFQMTTRETRVIIAAAPSPTDKPITRPLFSSVNSLPFVDCLVDSVSFSVAVFVTIDEVLIIVDVTLKLETLVTIDSDGRIFGVDLLGKRPVIFGGDVMYC